MNEIQQECVSVCVLAWVRKTRVREFYFQVCRWLRTNDDITKLKFTIRKIKSRGCSSKRKINLGTELAQCSFLNRSLK